MNRKTHSTRILAACFWAAGLCLGTPITRAEVASAVQSTDRTEYVIGAGDVIKVSVFQNPDLSLEARINENGTIRFPLIGVVRLGGLTVSAAEKALADGLRTGDFVKEPQVTVLLTQVRANLVSVLGQVGKPGRYPLEVGGTKLMDVLAQAGGVAPGGSDILVLSGQRGGKPFRKEIDMPAVLGPSQDNTADVELQNGDVIFIDRAPQIYIYGQIQRPGVIRLERNMTLMQAMATAGGLTPRGTEKGLRVNRRKADGKLEVIEPGMNDLLRPDDIVYVRESIF
ncbi:polysaccharide export protein EpsE [Piscinibacter sp. SJAQ100]|uniref:Polysaccharide export protein EpsE n=2 Tax=Aquariibacter albus TaxID=2759899 RepID=A0A839HIS6_9BURK|nr:polysaccharide export protein EpsE [Aquariibacter albus]